ncbi:hypothetical protein SB758_33960, partial [Burkholderia sp. SIMBA_013]
MSVARESAAGKALSGLDMGISVVKLANGTALQARRPALSPPLNSYDVLCYLSHVSKSDKNKITQIQETRMGKDMPESLSQTASAPVTAS